MTAGVNTRLRPILVASHPRSGTHLTIDFIRKTFPSTSSWRLWGLPLNRLYLNIDLLASRRERLDPGLAKRILQRPDRALMKTHFLPDFSESWTEDQSSQLDREWRKEIEKAHIIYVTRHPAPVMRSYRDLIAYYSPEYADLSIIEFCKSLHWTGKMDRIDWWKSHVTKWLAIKDVIHVDYDRLLSDPKTVAMQLAQRFDEEPHLSENLLPKKVSSVWQVRRSRLTSLAPESTAIIVPRARRKADADTAEEEERLFFEERAGALLRRMGIAHPERS